MKRIEQMISQKSSDDEIALRVNTFIALYSDYGEERQRVLKTQMTHLKAMILPTKITKMLLWFLEQDDSFFESSDIWKALLKDIDINPAQKMKFLSQRNLLGKQSSSFKTTIRKLKSLEDEVVENMKHRSEQMKEITNIFTPSQQAKFLYWVEKNEACVQLLDTLWKKRVT